MRACLSPTGWEEGQATRSPWPTWRGWLSALLRSQVGMGAAFAGGARLCQRTAELRQTTDRAPGRGLPPGRYGHAHCRGPADGAASPPRCVMPGVQRWLKRRWPSFRPSKWPKRSVRCLVQTLGGYGYLSDFPLERIYRDVRVCRSTKVSSDIQRAGHCAQS